MIINDEERRNLVMTYINMCQLEDDDDKVLCRFNGELEEISIDEICDMIEIDDVFSIACETTSRSLAKIENFCRENGMNGKMKQFQLCNEEDLISLLKKKNPARVEKLFETDYTSIWGVVEL